MAYYPIPSLPHSHPTPYPPYPTLTRLSGSLTIFVKKSSRMLLHALRWLSDCSVRKYSSVSLPTLKHYQYIFLRIYILLSSHSSVRWQMLRTHPLIKVSPANNTVLRQLPVDPFHGRSSKWARQTTLCYDSFQLTRLMAPIHWWTRLGWDQGNDNALLR